MKPTFPMKAWAVLNVDDKLSLTDERLPLFWIRKTAQAYNQERLLGEGIVVRVTVDEVR